VKHQSDQSANGSCESRVGVKDSSAGSVVMVCSGIFAAGIEAATSRIKTESTETRAFLAAVGRERKRRRRKMCGFLACAKSTHTLVHFLLGMDRFAAKKQ